MIQSVKFERIFSRERATAVRRFERHAMVQEK
jgi:hypothetical protein